MITVKKTGQQVKGIYDEDGNFKGVIVGELFRFVATWKGELYKGFYLHCIKKASPIDELRAILQSNQLQKIESLVKI